MVCGFSIYGGKDTKKTKNHISKLGKKLQISVNKGDF